MGQEQYKFDMHIHTGETSGCGEVSARDAVRLYQKAGYQGIMITDHYHKEYFDGLGDVDMHQKVETFLTGYREAKAEGDKIGLDVILGIEFRNTETDDDFLIVGVTEEFLHQYPNSYELPLKQAIDLFHSCGMLVIQAHPIRFAVVDKPDWQVLTGYRTRELLELIRQNPGIREISFEEWKLAKKTGKTGQLTYPFLLRVCELQCEESLDGIEIYNGNDHWAQEPEGIERILNAHPSYIRTSASDFHEMGHLARGGMVLNRRVKDSEELKQVLLDGDVTDWIYTND